MARQFVVFLIVAVLRWSAGTSLAQAPPSPPQTSVETDIRAVIDAQEKAWNEGNIDAFMNGYWRSDQTAFVGGGDITRGWETVRQRYKAKYPDREHMGTLTFSQMEVSVLSNDSALVSGQWQLQFKSGKSVHGRTSLIFRHVPEGWRIVYDHSSTG